MNAFLLVGLGGVAGAVSRHLLGERIDERTLDTLAVNVVGSLLLGFLVAAPPSLVPDPARLALGVGFCGAFTTFSTFAFETVRLAEMGEFRRAALNGGLNLVGALAAIFLGSGVAGLVA